MIVCRLSRAQISCPSTFLPHVMIYLYYYVLLTNNGIVLSLKVSQWNSIRICGPRGG